MNKNYYDALMGMTERLYDAACENISYESNSSCVDMFDTDKVLEECMYITNLQDLRRQLENDDAELDDLDLKFLKGDVSKQNLVDMEIGDEETVEAILDVIYR